MIGILLRIIRSNFYIYVLIRKVAKYACRFLLLEDGFIILRSLRKDLQESSVVIDVGSNDGTSFAMIRQSCKQNFVISFDPVVVMPTQKFHKHNQFALGNSFGTIKLYTPIVRRVRLPQYSSNSKEEILALLKKDLKLSSEKVTFASQEFKMTKLDCFGFTPFFLKVDVEGQELQVLKGARETIETHNPILLVELNSEGQYTQVLDFLSAFGYTTIVPSETKHIYMKCNSYNPSINNYIFINELSKRYLCEEFYLI